MNLFGIFSILVLTLSGIGFTQSQNDVAETTNDSAQTVAGVTDTGAAQTATKIDWSDPKTWMDELLPLAAKYATSAIGALLVLFVAWILAGIVSRFTGRSLERARIDVTLVRFFKRLVYWLVLILGLLACLSLFGIETTSFAAVLGSIGLAIGLALQGTLGNFASGIMLLAFRPFRVGDVVNLADHTGKVFAIDLFTTSIDTFDNRRIIIPNGAIFDSTIENITYHPQRRVEIAVGVDYSADIDTTRELLTQAAFSVPAGLKDPEPQVVLNQLGASSVDWQIRVWANGDDFSTVKQGLIRAVKMTLDEANIGIPYPQMDVHLNSLLPENL